MIIFHNNIGGLSLVKMLHLPFCRYWLVAFISPWSRGSLLIQREPFFLEGMLRDYKQYPCESLPYPLVSSSLDDKILVGRSSLLSNGIYFMLTSFLMFFKGEKVKTEVN